MKNFYKFVLLALMLIGSAHTDAQVPIYNSYPSATAVLLLDFDGHLVTGTSWNGAGDINAAPSGLTTEQITEVFNRVAEDYRPFNINVTTDPAKYTAAPANRRMRVILTVTSEWYGSAGGVAYTGSFSWGNNTPCWVFTALLGYQTKAISEAAAHEAGHTFGLRHQSSYDANCNKTSDYNLGTGSGEIGWAPIMGVGYYQNFTVWHNGPNTFGCTTYQSDLDVLTNSTNGFGYRTDDHGSTSNASTSVDFVNNEFTINGVVERTTDQDMFKVVIPQNGRFQLDAVPYNVGTGNSGSDLDLQVDLMSSNQNIIASYNPGNALSSIIDTTLNAGTYYLRVDGKGNQYATDYGSLGSYSLQGKFGNFTPLPLRKLELRGITEADQHKLNWTIDADEAITSLTVEVSTNGRNFSSVTQMANDGKAYSYRPNTNGTLLYRLNVAFENGRQYFSNTVALKSNSVSLKPQLVTNLIQTNSLMINSPDTYSYIVSDYMGKVVSKGQVQKGVGPVQLGFITNGMYLIQFSNGREQHVEKFMKN